MEFVLGHGTENDFVLLPDPDGRIDLTDALVRGLCHRRRGLGGDGVLRVVRTDTDVARDALAATGPGGTDPGGAAWFMDYRNADGSVAEMCGNGVRVFARHLVDSGLAAPGVLDVATRAGVRRVELGTTGDVRVDMGPARTGPVSTAVLAGGATLEGVAVDVGNPHLACVLPDGTAAVDGLDLTVAPGHDAVLFPHGVNVEFLSALDGRDPTGGTVRLRVHERGSGETRSCGTGTVAGAVAALRAAGREEGTVTVDTPGGLLRVGVGSGTTSLTGPAVLVAHGDVDPVVIGDRDHPQ